MVSMFPVEEKTLSTNLEEQGTANKSLASEDNCENLFLLCY